MTRIMEPNESVQGRQPASCDHCGTSWLVAERMTCPLCFAGTLETASVQIHGAPELAVPFKITPESASEAIATHADRTPFAHRTAFLDPSDLVPLFVPLWLVDAHMRATWEVEIGFDEVVKSHVERLRSGSWKTEEVSETRVRWEPRAGTADRWYDNIVAPALQTWGAWSTWLDGSREGAFSPRDETHPILLPDRPVDEVWPDTLGGFHAALGADLRRASQGQHHRELYTDAEWSDKRWTWLLLPVYAGAYRDHEGRVHILRVDGRTGKVSGRIAASPAQARFRASLWFSVGIGLCGVSLLIGIPGIILWPLLALTAIGLCVGVCFMAGAFVPLMRVSRANRALHTPDPHIPS